MTARRVVIAGRVQGVGFRAWVSREARARGLKGFVRNRIDGTVEAVFSGPADMVDQMIEACRLGPRLSLVRDVETSPATDEGWTGFTVISDE